MPTIVGLFPTVGDNQGLITTLNAYYCRFYNHINCSKCLITTLNAYYCRLNESLLTISMSNNYFKCLLL